VLGKVSGVWSIQLSRKLTTAEGRTLGVVVASISPMHFAEVYGKVQLGTDGAAGLAGLDGVLRVRVVEGSSHGMGAQLADRLRQALRTRSTGAITSQSSDGIARIFGFSQVGSYPLVVVTGTSQESAFASWRTTRNTVGLLTALLSLAVVAFAAVLLGSIRRLALGHAALVQSEAQAQRANQA